MRVLLISTYDLGRQPLGLASPAAFLREAGCEVECVDTSRTSLLDESISHAALVGFYLPMHTATRLAGPLIDRVLAQNPGAVLAAYGLYAPLNAEWLRVRGVAHVLGDDAGGALADVARQLNGASPAATDTAHGPTSGRRGHRVLTPDRTGLPELSQYASLRLPDGTTRVVGNTDATRGCKHLCRHCPVVPVYNGTFKAVPLDVVMADVSAQIDRGASHISFGDPDFFNGPTHARRLVERLHREHPSVTYDVTIKVEHLLAQRELLATLRATGCLFVTSAVESFDDRVLAKLEKGHTRADVAQAVTLCREAGLALAPTFVPFTPWTTVDGYLDLIEEIERLDLVSHVAPIQLAIRLLVTAKSRLLELEEIRGGVDAFDPDSLTWPWRHADARVDGLQRDVMQLVTLGSSLPRGDVFAAVADCAYRHAGRRGPARVRRQAVAVPTLSENWYCCAEPITESRVSASTARDAPIRILNAKSELRTPRLLLFATTTGYQIRAFSDAARDLGVELIFASDRCDQLEDPWWDQAIPVRFHHEDDAVAAVLAATRGAAPSAVLAVGDRPVPLAARVASALRLPGNPADAARRSRNKLASRQVLAGAGLLVPEFRLLSLAGDPLPLAAQIGYPVVLKPLALSGSRGVMRADDDRSLTGAFERLRRLLASPDVRIERDALHEQALLESFIPGREYAIEGMLTNGTFTVLAIFDKPDPLDGPFFEETIYVTPSEAGEAVLLSIGATVAAAASAIGLVHGPVHAEVRVNARGVYVLEVASRPIGGLCSRALMFEADGQPPISLESLLLRHALGDDVSGWRRERRASGVMMMPIPSAGVFKGVEGVDAARAVAGVEDVLVTAKPDAVLVPLPEGRSYLGFIFARGETSREVERSLRDAYACLTFTIQRNLDVVSPAAATRR